MRSRALESQLTWSVIVVSLPVSIIAILLGFRAGLSLYLITLMTIVQLLIVVSAIYKTRGQLTQRLRGLATVVESAMLGDYTIQAREEVAHSALSDLVKSINALSQDLSKEKIATVEKGVLLSKIITQIQVGVITADANGNIGTINKAARGILGLPGDQTLTNLQQLPFTLSRTYPGNNLVAINSTESHLDGKHEKKEKRIFVQQDQYREFGVPQQLILVTDLNNILRQEELKSWENLIRVISHEINNSLAPVASLSDSLISIIEKSNVEQEYREDMLESAHIISERAKSLVAFIAQYRNLVAIRPPVKQKSFIRPIIEPLLCLFKERKIVGDFLGDQKCAVDSDQLKQVFINLIKNAIEAMQTDSAHNKNGTINITLQKDILDGIPYLCIKIDDTGCGIKNYKNLFVPFYSTKTQGSGIGLALSRQIVELHGGSILLRNKPEGAGCIAMTYLPICDD